MVSDNYIRLTQWAAQHGMHRMTAWRHYHAGTLSPELQPKKMGNIIYVLANPGAPPGRIVGYARVSSAEQKGPLGESGQPTGGLRGPEWHPPG